ncbi:MAG: S8 family serine peptidase [Lachnospiraceae bacterium]|nr:S8 family serine peptidase [Lachnospiraceae bacterium]
MKKIVSAALILSLISSGLTSFSIIKAEATKKQQNSITDSSKYETNDLIVVYKNDANATAKKTMSIASLSANDEATSSAEVLTDKTVILKLDSKEALEDAIDTFSNDSRVAYIQPNYVYHSLGTNIETIISNLSQNTYYSKQWAYANDGSLNYTEVDYRTSTTKKWPNTESSSTSTLSVQSENDIDIDLPEAWESLENSSNAIGNRETIVALVDTGIMYDHTDLADNMWVNTAEANGAAGVDDDGNGYIDDYYGWNFYGSSSFIWSSRYNQNGNNTVYNKNSSTEDSHGTHGAGTIAATNNSIGVAGIASNSNTKLMSVKALGGTNGEGSTESVVKGIQYAIDNGASIINLSLGGEEDDYSLRNIIKNNPDVLFTIASGNGDDTYNGVDNDQTAMYPANYSFDNVVSVANIECDGQLHYSSNYGAKTVHIAAPGSYIISTSTTESDYSYSRTAKSEYALMTGTSMAAPMVAGVAAMLYSKYSNLTMSQICTAILESAVKLDSLSGKIKTGGMLNANEAVKYIENTYCNGTSTTTKAPTTTATPTIKPTATPVATTSKTTEPMITSSPTPTIAVTPTATPKSDVNPTVTTPATVTPISDLTITDITFGNSVQLNKPTTITVSTIGSSGTVTYDFFIPDVTTNISNTTGICSWTPKSTGLLTIIVYARDTSGGFDISYKNITVPKPSVTLSKKGSVKKGGTISVTAKTSNGTSPYTYTFKIYRGSKLVKTISTNNKTIKYKFTKTGTYKIKVIAKDAYNNKVTKTMTIKVKK